MHGELPNSPTKEVEVQNTQRKCNEKHTKGKAKTSQLINKREKKGSNANSTNRWQNICW